MFSKRRHSKTRRCILLISFVCFPFEYKARIRQLRRGSSKRWVYYIRLFYTVYNNRVSNRSLFCTCCCGNREHEALDIYTRRRERGITPQISRSQSKSRNESCTHLYVSFTPFWFSLKTLIWYIQGTTSSPNLFDEFMPLSLRFSNIHQNDQNTHSKEETQLIYYISTTTVCLYNTGMYRNIDLINELRCSRSILFPFPFCYQLYVLSKQERNIIS